MAEQTFRSPGFFEREIDLSQRESEIVGVPAGVVGTAEMGPAFVPVTVGSFADFEKKFGTLDPKKFGPYAVREFFKYKTALTYVRVLGAGSNETSTDIANTRSAGIVKNAGFKIIGSNPGPTIPSAQGRFQGCVQFIAAEHWVSSSQEGIGYPIFSDNDSFPKVSGQRVERARLIRGMLFTATGSRFEILCMQSASYGITAAKQTDTATVNTSGEFKLVLSSAAGTSFANDDGWSGIRIYTASLNPVADTYIGKLLNTDPERFGQEQHLLYADFPVEDEIASVSYGTNAPTVALLSGSTSTSLDSGVSGLSFINGFGRFDTRYASPKTTNFISQPYGDTEFDLFYVESISDGSVANEKFKVSISNVRKSSDPKNPYGTFTLEVRDFDDTDTAKKTLESYPLCTLNPLDDDYLAKKVGDFKAFYNFDAELDDERKVLVSGKYPNKSSRVRVIMSVGLESGEVPKDALPFGFRGFGCLKTNDTLTNNQTTSIRGGIGSSISNRTTFWSGSLDHTDANQSQSKLVSRLSGSILPPVPFRFKVTRGAVDSSSPAYIGAPGDDERVDTRFYWGSKFDRLPRTGSLSNSIFDSNVSSEINNIFRSYSKLLGIEKLDNLVTGSGADAFNNNKFTLARVALSNEIRSVSGTPSLPATANSDITGSAKEHILETAYIRNGRVDASNYTVSDNLRGINRITFASLASLTSSVYFNRFTDYAKFTNFMHGGFDGLNILNAEMARMSDRASSSDTGGYAAGGTLDLGLSSDNTYGAGKTNTIVASYRVGARILTDPMASRVNILMIPGIRDSALTDYVQSRLSNYSKAFYVMDLPGYDADQTRLFDDSDTAANVQKTAEQLEGRALDSNYSATYFPDVTIEDPINNMPVVVPASVAVMGALAYNDNVAYPWFAPAGFNRAALDFVSNVGVRLNQSDRDTLYDAKINPIATFPGAGFVIFGQKTLQLSKSALDRVNVRRMLLEVKRLIVDVANKIVFEQNTPETRARFVAQATPLLATIQGQQGIDQFKVVMDASNNSQEDIENNILNGKIVLVPTRAVEFIAIDFIITNAGVSFD